MSNRHQIRAKWHDYNSGIYFVTICSRQKLRIFGRIVDNTFYPTMLGEIVEAHIKNLPSRYEDVELWNYVVMPNHIHLVLAEGTRLIASTASPTHYGCLKPQRHGEICKDFHHNSRLSVIIGALKAGVTREARTRLIASLPCWQNRFHEHIIRSQRAYENIMEYVDNNVTNWNKDCFNE